MIHITRISLENLSLYKLKLGAGLGIEIRPRVGLRGVQIPAGHRDFTVHQNTGPTLGPPSLPFNGY
jgi:hypothetical protein